MLGEACRLAVVAVETVGERRRRRRASIFRSVAVGDGEGSGVAPLEPGGRSAARGTRMNMMKMTSGGETPEKFFWPRWRVAARVPPEPEREAGRRGLASLRPREETRQTSREQIRQVNVWPPVKR